ncbi:MAG: hypothetical protein H7Y02_04675 [Candidatus Obscuribacterales bacterium]|nr:hypothetical protein [Steroidobacteraceae bacterium]
MNLLHRWCCLAASIVLGVSAMDAAHARKKAPPKLLATTQTVQDLYYGDVLFYFYQDDYFQALTRVDAALTLGRVPHHDTESQLLKGGLYLSLGQHAESGRIFKQLLNDNVPDATRNRVWFYLAKVWYQRGYLTDAEHALNAIVGKLADDLESERVLLHAEVLMGQSRFAEAITVLNKLPREDRYAPYARFNLGVALVREQRMAEAIRMLDDVGQMAAPTEELAALRDKANLALGFAYLKDNQPLDAAAKLQRVRLQGPQSNKALLGAGWADSANQRYSSALVPWQELRSRSLLDAAVQEAHLAVPYAYAQLSATRQAAEQYASAIDAFHAESARIDESIESIRRGGLLAAILKNDPSDKVGWYWQLQQLPDAPETRYLFHLLATHEFQEGLKNYRDLRAMQGNLGRWSLAAEAFQSMIDTRRQAYAERVPRIDALLNQVDLSGLEARKIEIASRLAEIERTEEVTGLATEREAEQWHKVQQLTEILATADDADANTVDMREKLKLLRGVLYWNMNASYKARLWHARKEQRELEVAVKEARRRWTLIERARVDSPKNTDEFGARVTELYPRIETLLLRLDIAGEAQNRYLAAVAIKELTAQKERLASYGLQAQFALASIYDRAASGPVSPSSAPVVAPASATP